MLKWLNNKKKDNKGFSLVELIIVVAIMAILVGLLAPQYIKYVEKSRKSADANNINEIVNALQVYAADPENELPADTYTITVPLASNSKTTVTATTVAANGTAATNGIKATAADFESIHLKSSKWGKNGSKVDSLTVTVVVEGNGSTTVTYGNPDEDQLATFMKTAKS